MKKLFFTVLMALVAFAANAQRLYYLPTQTPDTLATDTPYLEERKEYTSTPEAQTIQCESSGARIQLYKNGPRWQVYHDKRTGDIFALELVTGKGWRRVLLGDAVQHAD
jgi:hypothetical protein